jgi:hypothetical protein
MHFLVEKASRLARLGCQCDVVVPGDENTRQTFFLLKVFWQFCTRTSVSSGEHILNSYSYVLLSVLHAEYAGTAHLL